MDYTYSYPPSDNLLSLGNIVNQSNFYAQGIIFLRDNIKVNCKFEIGYTQSGAVVVVCYFPRTVSYQSEHKKERLKPLNDYIVASKILGRDFRYEYMICAENLFQRKMSTSFGINSGTTIIFTAKCFRVYISDKDLRKADSEEYRIFHPTYGIVGIDFPFWFTNDVKLEHYETNSYDFKIKTDFYISLSHIRKPKDRQYDNQVTGKASVHKPIELNWDSDEVMDYWCSLFSLATGRNVRWIENATRVTHWNVDYLQRNWRGQHLHGIQNFVSLMIAHGGLGLSNNWKLIEDLIKSAFIAVLSGRITIDDARDIVEVINFYVDYRLALTETTEGEMLLLCALTEYMLKIWEKSTGISTFQDTGITEEESEEMRSILSKLVDENKQIFLNEKDETLYKKIKSKLLNQVSHHPKQKTYEQRLLTLFRECEFISKGQFPIDKMIKAFLKTRHAITHDGEFAHMNTSVNKKHLIQFGANNNKGVQIGCEIANVRQMIPLMIFAMIGYEGEYVDLIARRL
ncbi:MAG: HEPN domain-containing protein [Chloroflexota bacterium]